MFSAFLGVNMESSLETIRYGVFWFGSIAANHLWKFCSFCLVMLLAHDYRVLSGEVNTSLHYDLPSGTVYTDAAWRDIPRENANFGSMDKVQTIIARQKNLEVFCDSTHWGIDGDILCTRHVNMMSESTIAESQMTFITLIPLCDHFINLYIGVFQHEF